MGLSDILGGGESKVVQMEPFSGARKMRKKLASVAYPSAVRRLRRAGQAYPGEMVAPLSEYEEMGLQRLGTYLGQPEATETDLFRLGKGELEKTLGGEEYDPLEGAYWQAYKTQMDHLIKEAKDRIAARTSARDMFYGGGRLEQEREVEEQALRDLGLVLGELYERERVRRGEAVPEAMRTVQMGEMLPLQRISAAQEFGRLPREIGQAQLDAEYQEWLRQLQDLGLPLDVAIGMSTYKPQYAVTQASESPLGGIADLAGAIAEMYASSQKTEKKDSGTDWLKYLNPLTGFGLLG